MAIYFNETGKKDAPTIVFIHGAGVAGWMWQRQIEYFKDFHCIVPDLPEHGKSIDQGEISLEDCANRISTLIEEKANGGKAHLVGHSLGGKIIVELLARRPDVARRAVVASALYKPIPFMKLTHKRYIYKLTCAMIKNDKMLSYSLKQFKFPDDEYYKKCMADFRRLTPDMLYRQYDQLYQYIKLPGGLKNANVPTLVVAGQKEPKAMRQSVDDIVKTMPDAKGILVEKADHTYPWSMSDRFNDIVRSWLESGV